MYTHRLPITPAAMGGTGTRPSAKAHAMLCMWRVERRASTANAFFLACALGYEPPAA